MRTPLRTKLMLLVAVPLLVLLAATTRNVQQTMDGVRRGEAAASRIKLSLAATTAALELAQEQGLSASSLTQPAPAPPAITGPATDLSSQRDQTSEAIEALRATITAGSDDPLAAAPALDKLDLLGAAREAVDAGGRSSDEVLGAYTEIIDPVLDLDRAVELAGNPAMVTQLDSFQALSRALQEAVVEQSLLRSAFATGTVDAATYNRLIGSVTSQRLWLNLFERNANSAQLQSYSDALAIPAAATSLQLRNLALAAGPNGPVQADPATWTTAMDRKVEVLESVLDDSAKVLAQNAVVQREAATDRRDRAVVLLLATLGLATVVLLLAYRIAVRPLAQLGFAARKAAHVALPAAMEIARSDGPDAARRALPPLPVPSDRDLAELAGAFNAAQTAALVLATDDADLRSKVNALFLNFGHRTQDLVTRQLGHIDDLEARTEDPDTLSDLFRLDHLATRLRRNAETLLVLAGADSPRPWARPVSVMNVVRAAIAEAIDYSRVDVETVVQGAIAGEAANDVSHLLAELIDSALAFAPAGSRVKLAGSWTESRQYLVTVADEGSAMTTGQLVEANERIAGSNLSDPGMSRYFGMFVVGRFARRHGIEVQLVPSGSDGTVAEVLLPDQLMAGALVECQTTPGR